MLHDLVNFALGLASLALSGLVIRVYHYFDAMETRQEENEDLLFTARADLISLRREIKVQSVLMSNVVKYLKDEPAKLIFTANVSVSINIVASSLRLAAGEILTTSQEYGSMKWALFYSAECRPHHNTETRRLDVEGPLSSLGAEVVGGGDEKSRGAAIGHSPPVDGTRELLDLSALPHA
jgi:hypothetical protein